MLHNYKLDQSNMKNREIRDNIEDNHYDMNKEGNKI